MPTSQPPRHTAPPSRDRGFTLVEILIAIVLVGILSAVVVVGVSSLTDKGSESACTASLDAAKAASVVYFAGEGAYPTTFDEMLATQPAVLTLPSEVTASGTQVRADSWTLTMAADANGAAPTFTCGDAASAAPAPNGTAACPGTFAGWVGEYYANRDLSGTPALCRDDAAIDFNWAGGSAGTGVPADNFSVRWTRTETFTAGSHTFTVGSDDGVRLFIDGTPVITSWSDRSYATQSASHTLSAGAHVVVMEFYERGGVARASLSWT